MTGARVAAAFRRGLEAVVVAQLVALALLVVAGVVFRKLGAALAWYDEVASVLLAWLTYYGAALAALERAHIGFPGLVAGLPRGPRLALVALRETIVVGFFILLAWAGWRVLDVLAGTSLVSLPEVPLTVAHSALPIGAVLFVVAELLTVPERVREARGADGKPA